jgi:N-acetylglucosamine-6-phosphate deacetylase
VKGIRNGLIFTEGTFKKDLVVIFGETITFLQPESEIDKTVEIEWIDAGGGYVLPGFIDIHVHGYKGHDVMDATTDSLQAIGRGLVENGVTSFLATTMTMPMSQIEAALMNIEATRLLPYEGAHILGAHLEGPFINKDFKGAQPENAITLPESTLLDRFHNLIKVVTIAPEVPGAMEMIEAYHKTINFSLGHTGADYDTAKKAFDLGAKGVTHLFNAMTGMNHRAPGVVGAALSQQCYCELIADGIHVHPSLFKVVQNAIGSEKVLLITDCMKGGGLKPGDYDLGGQKVTVKDGKCTLKNGTIAGSVLKLHKGLENYHNALEGKLEEVIPLVSLNQAQYLGIDRSKGSLEVGKDSDIVLMTKDFEVKMTLVKGKKCYEV